MGFEPDLQPTESNNVGVLIWVTSIFRVRKNADFSHCVRTYVFVKAQKIEAALEGSDLSFYFVLNTFVIFAKRI